MEYNAARETGSPLEIATSYRVRQTFVLAVICVFVIILPSQVRAGQRDAEEQAQLRDDISALQKDVRTIGQLQQQTIDKLNELNRVLSSMSQPPPLPSSLNIREEPFRGNSEARVAVIEYADFECPYCGQFERGAFPQLVSDYIEKGTVRYFYRDFPLPVHPHAMAAARAARCAGEQGKYWEMHDALFAKQNALSTPALLDRAQTLGLDQTKFSECLSSERYTEEIQKGAADAQKMGIEGTPTFFLGTVGSNGDVVNVDKRFVGTAPYDVFKSEIDALLAKTQ